MTRVGRPRVPIVDGRSMTCPTDLPERGADASRVAQALTTYERQTEKLIPRRATLHDVGTGLTPELLTYCQHNR